MIQSVTEYEDGKIATHTSKAIKTTNKFESGFYEASFNDNGSLSINKINLQEINEPYESKENLLITSTIDNFFREGIKDSVEKLGFIHKLGVLLYGKQGTGKTAIMNSTSKKMIDSKNAIVIFCNQYHTLEGGIALSKQIRLVQDNPILFIADEFDIYVRDSESNLKNLLDGKDSVSNSLFLASTNYIDRIPNSLKDRPSRFKLTLEITGISDKKIMKDILRKLSDKLSPKLFKETELDNIVKNISSITIDEIKQIALDKLTNTLLPKIQKQTIGFKINNDVSEDDEEIEYGEGSFQFPVPSVESLSSIKRKTRNKKKVDSNI